jgi:hypothetical protein
MLAGIIWESVTNRSMDKVLPLLKYIAPTDEDLGTLNNQISEIIVKLGGASVGDKGLIVNEPPNDPLEYSMNE